MSILRRFRLLALSALLALPLGCAASHNAPLQETPISGTVFYRERMALPPQAELRLVLYRVLPDGSQKRMEERTAAIHGQVPLPFELKPTLPETAACALEAAILVDGEPLFATPAPVSIRPGDRDIRLLTHRVLPDAPSQSSEISASVPADLTGKLWVLSSVGGKPAEVFPGQPQAHLSFTPEQKEVLRISGSDGCNRLVGTCTVSETRIQFSHLGSTMMLCPAGDEQARAFAKALSETTHWRFVDETKTRLELLKDSSPLLLLEAKAL